MDPMAPQETQSFISRKQRRLPSTLDAYWREALLLILAGPPTVIIVLERELSLAAAGRVLGYFAAYLGGAG